MSSWLITDRTRASGGCLFATSLLSSIAFVNPCEPPSSCQVLAVRNQSTFHLALTIEISQEQLKLGLGGLTGG
ncbi:uncharacterized protein EDB91DRAFT_506410 [Suillus paluster]|uniref:uncharacterized protein n=1 Tax=Suillus paluster TaxID=48578 RepID=UPI001B87D279|nr:uncharacterized protein EDB91DRAFT_705731 [Suillus paluster]XP_041175649.1 uncharacterized protein EDB91DRAFT_506410 [Suillus paluster]KAG1717982.1 hypothetical protein EDB91DRAFT_705731 [Suillus paluster]KAG1736463.1 hypothetical protein EDB91DRAFT_506410 [Suillus paluster]